MKQYLVLCVPSFNNCNRRYPGHIKSSDRLPLMAIGIKMPVFVSILVSE
jgi:hypothetical protein